MSLPHAPISEQGFLGGVLLGDKLERTRFLVSPGDFYDPRHAAIWAAMLRLRATGHLVDECTIAEELRDTWSGALDYIDRLVTTTLTDEATMPLLLWMAATIKRASAERRERKTA